MAILVISNPVAWDLTLYYFRLIRNCILLSSVGAGSPKYLISIDKFYKPAPPIGLTM